MADPQKALQTQLANIEKRTGRTIAQLGVALADCGKTTHGDKRTWLMETFGLGHGDANTLVHATTSLPEVGSGGDVLGEIYAGPKAHLRAVHDAVMAVVTPLGGFEVAPKKGYVSLRRKKQFAMLGPKSKERVELGLNLKEDISSPRVIAQKPGGMCQFAVSLSTVGDVDAEVAAALAKAFAAAS
jgi:Domain of unknown function (DUF4287)/Domain of unknown function (DUF5655)